MWRLGGWERRTASFGLFAYCGGELQVPVWIIFDDDNVVLAADSVNFLAALDGICTAGGILSDSTIDVSRMQHLEEEILT
jgi:D-aminopeptidase